MGLPYVSRLADRSAWALPGFCESCPTFSVGDSPKKMCVSADFRVPADYTRAGWQTMENVQNNINAQRLPLNGNAHRQVAAKVLDRKSVV